MAPELLYLIILIPISVGVLKLIGKHGSKNPGPRAELSRQIEQFNFSSSIKKGDRSRSVEDRAQEIEAKLISVSDKIEQHKKKMEKMLDMSVPFQDTTVLKIRLQNLYKEYDLLASENHALRARLSKTLSKDKTSMLTISTSGNTITSGTVADIAPINIQPVANASELDRDLYEDTRIIEFESIRDVMEVDLSELK